MKRFFISMVVMALASLFGPAALQAQRIYTNAKNMTIGSNLLTYYNVQRVNLTAFVAAVPEDKFYAAPPGFLQNGGKIGDVGVDEQVSIGAELAHGVDSQARMCTLIATGKIPDPLPGTAALKIHTKAAMVNALADSFKVCDPLIEKFNDANAGAMVNSQHALQPLITTIFNNISHDREIFGRIASYMVTFGIKAPREIGAVNAENPQNLYRCAGQESKTDDICTSK